MLTPSIFREDLWNDWMRDPLDEMDGIKHGRRGEHIMRTDVKECEREYEVDVELPGFKKADVKVELKDGYLTVSATRDDDDDIKDENVRYVRRERYAGNMSRSFYVGKNVSQDETHAKFEDGILKIRIPRETKKPDNHYVTIE